MGSWKERKRADWWRLKKLLQEDSVVVEKIGDPARKVYDKNYNGYPGDAGDGGTAGKSENGVGGSITGS